jgi:hypothetical protein
MWFSASKIEIFIIYFKFNNHSNMSQMFSQNISIKLLSGDIINITLNDHNDHNDNTDIIKRLIQEKFYQDCPISCIDLIKNEEEQKEIDYFLFIHDRIDLDCVLVKDCIYDSSGKFYEKYNIINKQDIITTVYIRKNFYNNFILSNDVKVLYSDDTREVIRMPTKYKDMKQVLQSCLTEKELKIVNFDCVMG